MEKADYYDLLGVSRDADAAQCRHQYQIAPRDANVRGQGRTLGSDPFFDDLNQHFVAASKDFLNGRFEAGAIGSARNAASRLAAS